MKKIFRKIIIFQVIFFFHIEVLSNSFDNNASYITNQTLLDLRECDIPLPSNANNKVFYANIINHINQIESYEISTSCKDIFDLVKKIIKEKRAKKHTLIFNSKKSELIFQDSSKRFNNFNNLTYQLEETYNKFSYRASVNMGNDKLSFDESYFSLLYGENVLSFGRVSRWWSSSQNTSLILSNSARPSPGLSINNLNTKNIDLPFFNRIDYDYEVFLNKLERERFVPEPYFFGMRLSTQINNQLNLSFYRTALFGGQGRPSNGRVFFDMLIGRDNYSSIDEKENEPGNQLAGIDFKYYFSSKKASIYGQLVGEDESGYLPSRTFYILGSEFILNQDIEKSINIEFTDTGTKIKNYVYSHFIYKDGYRYKGDPIGSVFDADSKILIINYKQRLKPNFKFHLRYITGDINYNDNKKNYFNNNYDDFEAIELRFQKINLFNTNIIGELTYSYNDIEILDNSELFFTLKYRW
jgi:hypothetical protein